MKIYLSADLILMGTQKELILRRLNCNERQWLETWQDAFQYQTDDKRRFDAVLLSNYQKNGFEGLIESVLTETAGVFRHSLTTEEADNALNFLKESLLKDQQAIAKVLSQEKENDRND